MIPAVIDIGPFSFHLYGLLVGLALVLGIDLLQRIGLREGISQTYLKKVGWWVVISGIVGARLYHVIDFASYYQLYPMQTLEIWRGGLGIWGGIGGGLAGLWLFARRYRLNRHEIGKLLDALALAAPPAQAIGRLGNFVNQELYGLPTTLPWGIPIEVERRLAGYEYVSHFHPLFLYEGLLLMILWFLMRWIYRLERLQFGKGGYLALYFFGYGIIRYFLEPLRIEVWKVGGMRMAQVIALVVILTSFWYVKRNWRRLWITKN
jgi:phosphatidylglycerol---prolipoprotein diacylglyceryl transferase